MLHNLGLGHALIYHRMICIQNLIICLCYFSRSTILVRMSIAGNKNLTYEPGDHLAVFPENRPELVNKLISLLEEAPQPDVPFKIEMCKEMSGLNHHCNIHLASILSQWFKKRLEKGIHYRSLQIY